MLKKPYNKVNVLILYHITFVLSNIKKDINFNRYAKFLYIIKSKNFAIGIKITNVNFCFIV